MMDHRSIEEKYERYHVDGEAYIKQAQTAPCFICQIVARSSEYPAHIVYEDEKAIAFLDKYPFLYGWTLVAPREHREQVAGDFAVEEYLDLQRVVYRVAEAVRREVGAERMYLLSFGSNQGHSHVHWHVAPLPPGVPYREQQQAVFKKGTLRVPEEGKRSLAIRLHDRIEQQHGT